CRDCPRDGLPWRAGRGFSPARPGPDRGDRVAAADRARRPHLPEAVLRRHHLAARGRSIAAAALNADQREKAMKTGFICLLPVAALLGTASAANAADPFKLTSGALEDNGTLAVKNAGNNKENPNCVGENVSPPLAWSNAPDGTKSLALLLFDPEGRGGAGVSH